MTTNAGARELTAADIGFQFASKSDDEVATIRKEPGVGITKGKDAIERTFSPEFRNRLDGWIAFNPLTHQEIIKVVDKFVEEVRVQLKEKNVDLELSETARQWLAKKGFDRLYGARPMARLIQQKIKEPLAEQLLFGNLEKGGKVAVDEKDGELSLDCQKNETGS
jgi:ATP-dependent Clp protease ATP-binding subunit ClpA